MIAQIYVCPCILQEIGERSQDETAKERSRPGACNRHGDSVGEAEQMLWYTLSPTNTLNTLRSWTDAIGKLVAVCNYFNSTEDE